jgi:hypothetical protein
MCGNCRHGIGWILRFVGKDSGKRKIGLILWVALVFNMSFFFLKEAKCAQVVLRFKPQSMSKEVHSKSCCVIDTFSGIML